MSADTEKLVTMPVVNMRTGKKMRGVSYAGMVDLLEDDVLVDWKTTGDPQEYIEQVNLSCQAELYALAYQEATGKKLRGVEYRLIQRPTIRFCNKDADMEAYAERCYQWLMEKPGALTEHPVWITDSRLDYARTWIWQVAERIRACRKTAWMKNEMACRTWQRPCPYLQLCTAESMGADVEWLIRENYESREVQHEELGDKIPANAVTYSSGKTLCLCEKKFYWRHEARIRPRRDESGEALRIGSLVHVGLERLAMGLPEVLAAIQSEADLDVPIGEDGWKAHDELTGKALAMARAAWEKWNVRSSEAGRGDDTAGEGGTGHGENTCVLDTGSD